MNNILGPVNKYPFKAPNTDINIPTVINLPPNGPNLASATADAGAQRDQSGEADERDPFSGE